MKNKILPSRAEMQATDEELSQILDEASLPALLPALAQATGDFNLISKDMMPKTGLIGATPPPQGGMSKQAQEKARSLALDALRRLRDEAVDPIDIGKDKSALKQLMFFITGDVEDDYVPLLSQELGVSDETRPEWIADKVAPNRDFRVAIIGAGMSGLVAAYRLQQANLKFSIFEVNADVGGTWLNNTYPGCRLDTSNFGYSYSFAQKTDWEQQFSDRDAVHSYFKRFSENAGIRGSIRFQHYVHGMTYDDESGYWTIDFTDGHGKRRTETFNAVISAVGQLNKPSIPEIKGKESFQGPAFHTAEWRHDVDLKNKRVAVVGTGASAAQVIPAIADRVKQMTVFQRTPTWFNPTPTYLDDLPEGLSWLLENVPYYGRWFRFYQFWRTVEGRRPYMQVDPNWDHPVSVSEKNEELRAALEAYLYDQFQDQPELLEKITPHYPPGAKRMPRDDGSWANTLKKENVSLLTDNIREIFETGIVTEGGELHDFDIIIWGTGFKAADFLKPMYVTGRYGVDLHEYWADDAKAYLGLAVPNFPNLFILYGPNTNLIFNGSLVIFSECGTNFIMDCLHYLLESDKKSIEVKEEVYLKYNDMVDHENSQMTWGASTVNSWYKNRFGRVSQNWPLPSLEYWRMTRKMDPEDFRCD